MATVDIDLGAYQLGWRDEVEYAFTPRKGPFMRRIANSDVRTIVHYVRVMRSPYLNVEMFTSTSPAKVMRWPDMLDIGGWHMAAYVDDMDAAIEHIKKMETKYGATGKKTGFENIVWALLNTKEFVFNQ